MPSIQEIVTFHDVPPPPGESPWVKDGPSPMPERGVVDYDPDWPRQFDKIGARIRAALGLRALLIEHVGSTAVPGLAAKPIIDIDLTVADPDDEASYIPALEAAGFEHRVREPWWYGHRLLRLAEPLCFVHVYGPDAPETIRKRILRDWLRHSVEDRELYARTKREAAAAASAADEHMMEYNARKEAVIRDIYARAFRAAGLLPE